MVLKDELTAMQANYVKKRLQHIRLKRPDWLRYDDPISEIYTVKNNLLQKGNVVFAHIVQANTILFSLFPHLDCPAHIVYSTSPLVAENPDILSDIAHNIYLYKNKPLESVPEEWREISRVITDEYDRSSFTFTIHHGRQAIETHLIPVMIFRKLLPKRKLCGSLLPVLTSLENKTVLVLPKRYWTKKFRKAWSKGFV